jgi:Bacterial Ig domain
MSSTVETPVIATNSVVPAASSDPPKLVPRSITFTIPAADQGAPSVTVHAVEDGIGNIDITETVNNVGNQHSDLGGLFFDIANAGPLTSSNLTVSGPDVTYDQVGDGDVSNLAPNAPGINMNGRASFDVGVAFTDVTTATFVLGNAAQNLTLNDLEFEEFGARPMAQSEKITAIAPAAPTAVGPADATTILEDDSVTIPVSALATDANPGATLAITEVTQPEYGSVTIINNGEDIVYNPDPGGSVLPLDYEVDGQLTGDQVTFQYAVEDSLGGTDSNTVTITETPVADPPTVASSAVTNATGATAFVMTATSDDYNADNGEERGSDFINPVTFTLSSGLVDAGATFSGNGLGSNGGGIYTLSGGPGNEGLLSDNLTLSAPGGAFGTITIAATADETEGVGSPATATAQTTQTIDIPTANPFTTTVLESAGPFVIPISALASDPNPSPNAGLFISNVTQPTYGTLSIAPNGQSLIYNPDGGPAPLDFEVNGQQTGDQVSFGYTVTNALGGTNSNTITVNQTPVADTPTVTDTVMTPEQGDPATLTRLQVDATSGDFDTVNQGSDFIQSLMFSGVPNGVLLSSPDGTVTNDGSGFWTLNGSPIDQGLFQPEIDVSTPASGADFNLGIQAINQETESTATASATTSQNIDVVASTVTQQLDFTANDQSIWQTGNAPGFSFNKFLGINTTAKTSFKTGPHPGPLHFSTVLGVPVAPFTVPNPASNNLTFGASISLKAGLQADLSLNSGSFNSTLPFNVTLNSIDNKTTNTLQVDPTDSQAPGGTLSTTSPNGSFALDFIFDALAKATIGAHVLGIGGTGNVTIGPFNTSIPIINFSSAKNTVNGVPVAFTIQIPIGEDESITAALQWPSVSTKGTGAPVSGPHTISSSGTSNPIFSLTADPIALAFAALGLPDPFSFKLLGVQVTLLSGSLGAGLDMSQAFNLNASDLTTPGQSSADLTLGSGSGATTVPFTFGTPITVTDASNFAASNGSIPVSLDLTPDATLENNTGLVPEFIAGLNLLSASIDALHLSVGPAFSLSTHIPIKSLDLSVYNKTFPVAFSSENLKSSIG